MWLRIELSAPLSKKTRKVTIMHDGDLDEAKAIGRAAWHIIQDQKGYKQIRILDDNEGKELFYRRIDATD